MSPLRCTRCQAYMNLHTEWQFNGQKAKCNLCGVINVVPPQHYCATDE